VLSKRLETTGNNHITFAAIINLVYKVVRAIMAVLAEFSSQDKAVELALLLYDSIQSLGEQAIRVKVTEDNEFYETISIIEQMHAAIQSSVQFIR